MVYIRLTDKGRTSGAVSSRSPAVYKSCEPRNGAETEDARNEWAELNITGKRRTAGH